MDIEMQAPEGVEPIVAPSADANAAPADPFDGVPPVLRSALVARGFSELTAVQRSVLAGAVAGRDLTISSQTGSGKTVALGFAVAPVLQEERAGKGPDVLIIVPTRELANQVGEELDWLTADLAGVRVASVTGGTPVFRDQKTLGKKPRVLVGTPGRLLDHVTSGVLDLSSVQELVLDEADQMLDMGFREELEGILDATPSSRRTHLVSATFPEGIRSLAARYQTDPVAIEGTRLGDANADIEHHGYMVHQRERYAALVHLLLDTEGEKTLVFVERRADAVEVAERLEKDGFRARPLSGELAQSQRERTLDAFRSGEVAVLVATDVAARGLDVPDVATVVQTSPPIDSQVYTHRSGRTGRAGKAGRSVLFASPNRKRRVERMMGEAGVFLHWKPVPDPGAIRDRLLARARTALDAQLDRALEKGPRPHHLEHARQLLETRDPADLVAVLLGRVQPNGNRAPELERRADREFGGARPGRPERGERRFERPGRDPRRGDRDGRDGRDRPRREFGRREPGVRGRGPRFDDGNAVRFFMNYGLNQGANPSRVLAAICRRGEVEGSQVGSIALHPNATTFDVRQDVAESFERRAGRRDPRDPKVLIRRDRGPVGGPEGRRPAKR